MILKNAKNNGNNGTTKPSSSTGSGSATSSSSQSESGGGGGGGRSSRGRSSSRSRSGSASANNTTPNVYGYHGPKKGILQSAVELTRRSKRAAAATSSKIRSRSKSTRRRSKSRSSLRRLKKDNKKKIVFQKGQRAFYRSSKGISKVTIVGIHHDSKLEPYYTIRLKDGKEKQMDGKHLTPVQQPQPETEEDGKIMKEEASNNENGGDATATAAAGGGHEDAVGNSSMTEPTSDSEDENEVIDYTSDGDDDEEDDKYNEQDQQQQQQQQQQDDDTNGHYQGSHSSMNDDEGDNNSDNNSQHHHEQVNHKKFTPGQDAYYRSPNGSIIKIQVLEEQQQPSSDSLYYTISHPDGTHETKNVKASSLATLMDLTSKELSMLMKERNNKRATESSSAGTGANSSVSDGKSIRSGKSQGGKSRSGSRGRTARGRHCRRPSTSRDQVECGEQGAAIAIVDAEDHEGYEAEGGELPTLMIGLEKSLSFPGTEVSSKDTEDELGDSSSPSTSELPVLPSAQDEDDNDDDDDVDAPSSSKVPDLPALICPYKMTKAKTEDGGTKMVRLYSAETKVYYKNAAGVQYATILGVHLDDLLDPFYSVRLEDGREKQTDNAHISLEDPRKNKEEDDDDAAEGGDEDEGDEEKEEQVEVVGDGEQDEPSSEDKEEEEEEEQVAEGNTFAEPVSRDPEESEAEVTTEPAVARQHRRHSLRRPSTDASSHRRPSVDDVKAPHRSKSFHSVDSKAQQRRNEASALQSSGKSFHSVDSKGQQRRNGAAARNEAAALRASLANMVEEQLNNAADDGDSKKHQSEAAASAKKNHRDATMYSTTSTHEPAAAAALVMPAIFALGDEVLYTSSQGEQARAVVKRLNRDKKNRPYYVVRLPKGKEKQVYGHRLRPYEPPETVGSRRSRSSSRASTRNPSRTRGRSVSSKVSTKTSCTSTASHARRLSVDSNDSRGNLSNSSRRSTSSRERHATRERARQDPSGHRRGRDERSVESSSSRGISVASSYTQHTSSNGRRTRSPSATPSEVSKRSTERGTERKSRRERSLSMMRRSKSSVSEAAGRESRRHGRERSHSRAPSDEPTYHKTSTRGRVTSRVPGVSTRSKVMSADTSSKASDEHGSKSENRTRSLSKLRSFRKSFVGMKKKQQK